MLPKHIIHLLSGGLDSVTMLYEHIGNGDSVHCVLFDYGQPHVKELDYAIYHCTRLGAFYTLVKLPDLGGLAEGSWIVPNRNAIMLNIAVNIAIKAKSDTVTIGCNKDDESAFPDCRTAFIQLLNTTLQTAEINVEVCAPYIDKLKWEIMALAQNFGVPVNSTWTCYKNVEIPCGECPACLKLEAACK